MLDNAGFELFTDLCLAKFLVNMKFVNQVVFHCKQLPPDASHTGCLIK